MKHRPAVKGAQCLAPKAIRYSSPTRVLDAGCDMRERIEAARALATLPRGDQRTGDGSTAASRADSSRESRFADFRK